LELGCYLIEPDLGRFGVSSDGEDDGVELVAEVAAVRVLAVHLHAAVGVGLKVSASCN
jgi:hypothetical protein